MAFVLVAHWEDIEESAFEMIAVFTNREDADAGKREMLARRSRIRSGDVAGYWYWYSVFDRGIEVPPHGPHWPERRDEALKMWPKIKAIIGSIPFDWFGEDWEYDVYEVRDGLSFPNGMEPALGSEVKRE